MNWIQIRNFRRFPNDKVYKTPFKDITILVGENNSGKSSMVKALLLIIEFLQSDSVKDFQFANKNLENTNIVTFGRAKNQNSNLNVITLALTINSFTIEIFISGDNDDTTGRVDLISLHAHEPHIIDSGSKHQFMIYPKATKANFSRSKLNLFDVFNVVKKEEKTKEELQLDQITLQIEHCKSLLSDLNKSSIEYIENNQTLKKLEDKVKILKKFIKANAPIQTNNYNFDLDFSEDKSFTDLLLQISDDASRMTLDKLKKLKNLDPNEAKKLYSEFLAFKTKKSYVDSIIKRFKQDIEEIKVYYLPSNTSKQTALFRIRDKTNALAQAIHEFYQIFKNNQEGEPHRFIKRWMSSHNGFDIGDNIDIILRASEAYEVNIIDEQKRIPLVDKGMGSIQAMLLIIRIAVIIEKMKEKKHQPLVIIEEPELNLHPALQSRLCDFFLEVHEIYGIKFIIESHSEYLIRKSQVFVKEREYEKEANSNPFSIIYFDKYGPEIYPMRYRPDGIFENDFGSGFYDESANLTLKML